MTGLQMALALLAVVAGVLGYLMTGTAAFLVVAAVGVVAGASGYVLGLGRRRPR